MAKKDGENKKRNKGYGKVIVFLGIILALSILANFTVPDIVKDVKADRGPFTTLGSKISSFIENLKSTDEESDEDSEDGENPDGEVQDVDFADLPFLGSWVYSLDGHDVIFTFNPDGTGAMSAEGYTADMEYTVKDDIITMKYYINGALDETEKNQYEVDGDYLYLTQHAGEGTRNELIRYDGEMLSTVNDEEEGQITDTGDISYADDFDIDNQDYIDDYGTDAQESEDVSNTGEIEADYTIDAGNGQKKGHIVTEGENVNNNENVSSAPGGGHDLAMVGTWTYDIDGSYVVFTFNDDGTGYMIADGESYDIEWDTDRGFVNMRYYADGSLQETERNKYRVAEDALILTGNSGNGKANRLTKQ